METKNVTRFEYKDTLAERETVEIKIGGNDEMTVSVLNLQGSPIVYVADKEGELRAFISRNNKEKMTAGVY